mmetsp:Transcript_1514/g.4706  ORF Transcript_1514/g.4706 Transcript_1514/m.4706 type:complete len:278 (-) Transcript_1514:323-1156(-)
MPAELAAVGVHGLREALHSGRQLLLRGEGPEGCADAVLHDAQPVHQRLHGLVLALTIQRVQAALDDAQAVRQAPHVCLGLLELPCLHPHDVVGVLQHRIQATVALVALSMALLGLLLVLPKGCRQLRERQLRALAESPDLLGAELMADLALVQLLGKVPELRELGGSAACQVLHLVEALPQMLGIGVAGLHRLLQGPCTRSRVSKILVGSGEVGLHGLMVHPQGLVLLARSFERSVGLIQAHLCPPGFSLQGAQAFGLAVELCRLAPQPLVRASQAL